MIDTVKFRIDLESNRHLFQITKDSLKFSTVIVPGQPGTVAMKIREYKYPERIVNFYQWQITNRKGYIVSMSSDEETMQFEVSIPKWYNGTSYLDNIGYKDVIKFIYDLRIVNWTITRIDMCRNIYFDAVHELETYWKVVTHTHGIRFTKQFKTGFIEHSKSSYNVMYMKHKDPRDLRLEIPILRWETKLNMRNSYDWRKSKNIGRLDNNADLFLFIHSFGVPRLNKFVNSYLIYTMPESYISQDSTRKQKSMYLLIKLYGSYKEAYLQGVISERTFFNYKSQKLNTLDHVPKFDHRMKLGHKIKLQTFLTARGSSLKMF